jgi:Tol biopolymer transport system component
MSRIIKILSFFVFLSIVLISCISLEPEDRSDSPSSETQDLSQLLTASSTATHAGVKLPTVTSTTTQAPTATVTPPGEGGGLIALTSGHGGALAIYTIDILSGEYTQHSFGIPSVQDPLWSPDGRQISFTGSVHIDNTYYLDQIFLVDIESNITEQITEIDQNIGPSWSPDGEKIAFLSARDGSWALYTMGIDGSTIEKHTDGLGYIDQPFWSPVGNQIILSDRISMMADSEIIGIEMGSFGFVNLTNHESNDNQPAWSPDGEKIAFVSDRDPAYKIYIMNPDGTNQKRLTESGGWEMLPRWSPDGSRIAFQLNIDGNWDIYIINTDGSGLTQITEHLAPDVSPVWSPDGDVIAFVSLRDDEDWEDCRDTRECNSEIYLFYLGSGELVRLTENSTFDVSPAWQPILR